MNNALPAMVMEHVTLLALSPTLNLIDEGYREVDVFNPDGFEWENESKRRRAMRGSLARAEPWFNADDDVSRALKLHANDRTVTLALWLLPNTGIPGFIAPIHVWEAHKTLSAMTVVNYVMALKTPDGPRETAIHTSLYQWIDTAIRLTAGAQAGGAQAGGDGNDVGLSLWGQSPFMPNGPFSGPWRVWNPLKGEIQ